MMRAIVAVALFVATFAAHAQSDASGCIYDPELGQFRSYDPDADQALVRETLAGRDTDASRKIWQERVVLVGGRRFEATGLISDTPDGLNGVLSDQGLVEGVRFFGIASDPYNDRIATIVGAIDCALQVYEYRPDLYAAWVEERPFVLKFPALAVDRASLVEAGGVAHAVGFMMRGHPHADEDDQSLYLRMTITADCDAQTATVLDERGYGAGAVPLSRATVTAEPIPITEINHPALNVLAQLACKRPTDWPEGTHLKDGLDPFSEMVHAAAHAQPDGG